MNTAPQTNTNEFFLGELIVSNYLPKEVTLDLLVQFLLRHRTCDWGRVSQEVAAANQKHLHAGSGPILSRHSENGSALEAEVVLATTMRHEHVATIVLPNDMGIMIYRELIH